MHSKVMLCSMLSLLSTGALADNASPPTYSGFFTSYVSHNDVSALAQYASTKGLGGYIVWPVEGDVSVNNSASLLTALGKGKASNQTVSAYWTNWGVYTTTRALPAAAYPIPGSFSQDGKGTVLTNKDLSGKLAYITNLTYSFLEAQTKNSSAPGTLYFNDPWADLTPNDSFCNDNPICTYAVKPGKTFAASALMGNFEAFAALPSQYPNLQTTISVGGYAHDNSFEDAFDTDAHIANFVSSASSILSHYNISGIDLDYENPNMTHAQSKQFELLVQKLSAGLPAGKYITVTVLANPAYLDGSLQNSSVGFAKHVLKTIAALPNVKAINLMTYDFHGAFDYAPDGSGKTGFLSNLYMPNNAPKGYDAKFSVDTSVQALINLEVPASKVGVGIPAYGRALANIDAGDGTGLFSTLTSNTVIPAGDLDPASCDQSINLNANSCSGSFSYNYIVNNMLSSASFASKDWQDNAKGAYNGSTAFANTFTPGASSPNYWLQTANTGRGANYAGINVIVTDNSANTFQSDYLGNVDGNDKTYTNTNAQVNALEGLKALTVKWVTYAGGPAGVCPGTFDFTSNTRIMVRVNTSQTPVVADCAVTHP